MKTILLLIVIALVLTVGEGQAAERGAPQLPVIGIIASALNRGTRGTNSQYLLRGLKELGYVEGKNIRIERRYYGKKRSLIPQFVTELARLNVKVIIPAGPTALRPILKATQTIPIVMPNAGSDPVGAGFVKSLSEPGGNATGIAIGIPGLGFKKMELLKEALPSVRSVVFMNPHKRPAYIKEYVDAARALDIKFDVVNVSTNQDFEEFLIKIAASPPDALMIEHNSLTIHLARRIGEFAVQHRLPTMNNHRLFVEQGGLISYGVDTAVSWRRAAVFVDKILKGANPATLPVESPQLELVVNLKTANKIGVTIPPEILLEANEVIK